VDRQTALRVGKILGAGLLAAGSIRRQGTTGALTVRLLHTETTEIVAAGSAFFDDATAPPEQVTAPLAAQLLEALRSDRKKRYLLQGEILRTTPTVLLNIGAAQGMVPGLHLEIVEALEIDGTTEYITRDDLGQLIVTDVQVRSSQAKSASSSTSLHKGWKVREVYTP
jgi:TolB-like protein